MPFSFDAYDYLSFIIPGAVLLIGLMILFPWLRGHLALDRRLIVDVGGLSLLLILSFVLGQILNGLGREVVLGELVFGIEGAYATNRLLNEKQNILSDRERKLVMDCVVKKYDVDRTKLLTDNLKRHTIWRNAVRRMYADLKQAKRNDYVELRYRTFNLSLDLLSAFIILLVVTSFVIARANGYLKVSGRARDKPPRLQLLWTQFGVLVLVIVIGYSRMQSFDLTYARTLYLEFISLPECQALVKAS